MGQVKVASHRLVEPGIELGGPLGTRQVTYSLHQAPLIKCIYGCMHIWASREIEMESQPQNPDSEIIEMESLPQNPDSGIMLKLPPMFMLYIYINKFLY